MTSIAISHVNAHAPAPFTATPFLTMVLESQVGTPDRYISRRPANADQEMLEDEARSLELAGFIDQADLDAHWSLDVEAAAAEAAQISGDAGDVAFMDDGMPFDEEVYEEAIEPLA